MRRGTLRERYTAWRGRQACGTQFYTRELQKSISVQPDSRSAKQLTRLLGTDVVLGNLLHARRTRCYTVLSATGTSGQKEPAEETSSLAVTPIRFEWPAGRRPEQPEWMLRVWAQLRALCPEQLPATLAVSKQVRRAVAASFGIPVEADTWGPGQKNPIITWTGKALQVGRFALVLGRPTGSRSVTFLPEFPVVYDRLTAQRALESQMTMWASQYTYHGKHGGAERTRSVVWEFMQ